MRGLRLKHPAGWFAAGREMELALGLLSDGAFKLFVWLCLRAERASGLVHVTAVELARVLEKVPDRVAADLDELEQRQVCRRLTPGFIQITDRFWPYQRPPAIASPDHAGYVAQVRRLFLTPLCVRSAFTAADEKLAAELYRQGVSLQCVERAILLGCLRKYGAWLRQGVGTPISALHYFIPLFAEVAKLTVSPDYWGYVRGKLVAFEAQWRAHLATRLASDIETK